MKIYKGYASAGVYVPHFDQILVKISVLGVLYRNCCTDGKFGTEEGTIGSLLRAKFHPIGANCRPCGAKNLKIGL